MKYVRGEGPLPSKVVIIGEGPGQVEDDIGLPFRGPAGVELNNYLAQAGLNRRAIYVTNIVKYRVPGNEDPTEADIARDAADLYAELEAAQPEIIFTAGAVSTRHILGEDVAVDAVHGLILRSEWCGRPVVVVPGYHPAAGLHQPQLAARSAHDFAVLGRYVRGEGQARDLYCDRLEPTYVEGQVRLPDPPPKRIYIDTEGTPGRPYCLSASWRPGQAMILRHGDPWIPTFFAWIRRHKIRVVFHNALYDLQILREMGVELEPGEWEDTIIKAYQASIVPKALKHLSLYYEGMRMLEYSELTRPWDDRMVDEYLFRAVMECEDLPLPDPVLELDKFGKPKIRQPQHVTRRIRNILKRKKEDKSMRDAWYSVEPEIRKPVEDQVGELPAFTLDLVPQEKVIWYAGRDADATGRIEPHLDAEMDRMDLWGSYQTDLEALPLFDRMQKVGMLLDPDVLMRVKAQVQDGMEVARRQICKMCEIKWINPNSTPQVRALLSRLGLHSKFLTGTGMESTNDKALNSMYGQHPVIEPILDYREFATIDSRFTDALIKSLRSDGRLHPNWRLTEVVSGRPSCTDPNLLAIPVRSLLGKEVRGGFCVACGMKMGGADLNQVEMRFMAHKSRDPRLIKAYQEGRDIHAMTAADMFGVSAEEAKEDKYRDPAKRVAFGIITGITGAGLEDQFLLNRITTYDKFACDEMINDWFHIYKGVKQFIFECYMEAREFGYVKDDGGRIRYLPGIYSESRRVRGEAERASHSHKIQGGAAWLMKRIMKRLWDYLVVEWKKGTKVEPLLQVYDELELEIEEKEAARVMKEVQQIMEADSAILTVPIVAKYKIGNNWKEVK